MRERERLCRERIEIVAFAEPSRESPSSLESSTTEKSMSVEREKGERGERRGRERKV